MKFDFDKGWNEALALIKGNFSLLATIAGVLIFLPSAFAAIIFPSASIESSLEGSTQPTMEQLQGALVTMFTEYWWLFLGVFLLTSLAQLAMLALLRRRSSPTVGEALASGASLLPTFIGAYLLQVLAYLAPIFVLISLPAAIGLKPVALLGALFAIPLVVYISIKLSLSTPIIGIEGERNPVAALKRSWAMTKGNSLRLLAFFVLLVVAAAVLVLLLGWIVGLVFALGGEEASSFGAALSAGLIDALGAVFVVSILAAIHAQLSRLSAADTGEEA